MVDRSDLPWLVAGIQVNRGHVLFDLGAYDEASEAYERGLGRFLELGDADAVIGTAVGLVRCAAANGDQNAMVVGVHNLAEFMMTMTPTDLPGLLPIFESLERQLERVENAKAASIVAELRSVHLIPVSRSPARTGSATPPALVFEPLAI